MIKVYFRNLTDGERSEKFVRDVLAYYYGLSDVQIARTENGKPYLTDGDLQFSLSHTDGWIFLAVARGRVGLDAERVDRKTDFSAIVKKYPVLGEFDCKTPSDFVRLWTVVESNVKRVGGRLLDGLRKLRAFNGELVFENEPPAWTKTKIIEDFFVSVSADCPDEVCFITV